MARSSQHIILHGKIVTKDHSTMARSSHKILLLLEDRHKTSFYFGKIVTKNPFTIGKIVTKQPFTMGRSSQNIPLLLEDRHKTPVYDGKVVTKTPFHSGKTVTTPFHTVAKLSQFSDVVIVIRHVLGLLQKRSSCCCTGCQAMWCLCWDMVILLAMV